jgi:pyruvate formate lyase activating enzyme
VVAADALVREAVGCKPMFFEGGGVTFTGGEPLAQPEFLQAMLRLCRGSHIHTAIETSAHQQSDVFLKCAELLDFMFIDLKHLDPLKHLEYTGVTNAQIKKNIALLCEETHAGRWPGRLVIRMPVIRGFNDDMENARAMAAFLQEIGHAEVNLLPFHRLGESKWRQLGEDYDFALDEATPEEVLGSIQEIFLDQGILCYVGSDTPF